jgi:YggT family protein
MSASDVVAEFIYILSWTLTIAIIVRALLSWFNPAGGSGLARVLLDITEPILAPIRRILPPVGGIDFSPLLALILVQLISNVLISVLRANA